uniref:Uncharacterized protein n=1 Tax=Megaselia scalaris TaxID=36166 RepID=T1GJ64_MEGSC
MPYTVNGPPPDRCKLCAIRVILWQSSQTLSVVQQINALKSGIQKVRGIIVTHNGRTIRYLDLLNKANDTIQLDLTNATTVVKRERHSRSFNTVHIKDIQDRSRSRSFEQGQRHHSIGLDHWISKDTSSSPVCAKSPSLERVTSLRSH